MDVALSAEQMLLVETAERIAAEIGCPAPMTLPNNDDSIAGWGLLAQTGLVAMHVAESHGGGGSHSSDVALVVEQLAAQLCVSPYVGQGVLAPELAWRAGAAPQLLIEMAQGSRRVCVAFDEHLHSLARCGSPAVAWDARGATHALALADDNSVYLVEVDGPVLTQADITRVLRGFSPDAASGERIGAPLDDEAAMRFEAFALAIVAADLLGVMQSAVDAAVEYVQHRVQFGGPIGTFQAVQHLAADAKVLLEGARSSLWFAAWAADELDGSEALLASRQAKAYASRVALEVVELQTQLLGGIAITWEERAHLRVRRVLLDRVTFGDEFTHEDAIATMRLGAAIL